MFKIAYCLQSLVIHKYKLNKHLFTIKLINKMFSLGGKIKIKKLYSEIDIPTYNIDVLE